MDTTTTTGLATRPTCLCGSHCSRKLCSSKKNRGKIYYVCANSCNHPQCAKDGKEKDAKVYPCLVSKTNQCSYFEWENDRKRKRTCVTPRDDKRPSESAAATTESPPVVNMSEVEKLMNLFDEQNRKVNHLAAKAQTQAKYIDQILTEIVPFLKSIDEKLEKLINK